MKATSFTLATQASRADHAPAESDLEGVMDDPHMSAPGSGVVSASFGLRSGRKAKILQKKIPLLRCTCHLCDQRIHCPTLGGF
jgi:hypothetical protein